LRDDALTAFPIDPLREPSVTASANAIFKSSRLNETLIFLASLFFAVMQKHHRSMVSMSTFGASLASTSFSLMCRRVKHRPDYHSARSLETASVALGTPIARRLIVADIRGGCYQGATVRGGWRQLGL
jgi:hypothetical protein